MAKHLDTNLEAAFGRHTSTVEHGHHTNVGHDPDHVGNPLPPHDHEHAPEHGHHGDHDPRHADAGSHEHNHSHDHGGTHADEPKTVLEPRKSTDDPLRGRLHEGHPDHSHHHHHHSGL